MEKKIVANLLKKILANGFSVNIDNGGDCYELDAPTQCFKTLCKEVGAAGHDNLILFKEGREYGWVSLIWGNGEDIISDYSINLEKLVVK